MINKDLRKKNYINNILNNYFNIFVVILVSFLLFVSYLLLLKPKLDVAISAISENISSHEKLLQAEKNKLASLQEAVLAYNNINKTDLAFVNGILPTEYDKEALYGEIEEIVKQNGFVPIEISLTKENELKSDDSGSVEKKEVSTISPKIGTINISLSIASIDYAGMKNLLSVLENNLRLLDIKEVNFSDGSSATLKLVTYYYKK